MSFQKPLTTAEAKAVLLPIPSDIYFDIEADAEAEVQLKALNALEEMYGYYGADLA